MQEFLPDRNSCICNGFLRIPPDSPGFLWIPLWIPPDSSRSPSGFLRIPLRIPPDPPPDSSGFLRIPPDSSLFLPKAVWLGQGTNLPPTSSPISKLTCSPKCPKALPSPPKPFKALPSSPIPLGGSTAAGLRWLAAWWQGSGGSAVAAIAQQWQWQQPSWKLGGSLAAAQRHLRQHRGGKHGSAAAAVMAAVAVTACRQHGSGSGGGCGCGRQCVASATPTGMAVVAAATAMLPPHTTTVAMKTPAVTAMAGAHTTINNQLKAAIEKVMETAKMTAMTKQRC